MYAVLIANDGCYSLDSLHDLDSGAEASVRLRELCVAKHDVLIRYVHTIDDLYDYLYPVNM